MIANEKIISILKRTKIFSALKPRELQKLVAECEEILLPANKILFKMNDPSDCLYIVLKGRMAAYTSRHGELIQRVGDVVAGEVIGEMGVLTEKPRALTIKTITDVRLLKINEDVFKQHCYEHKFLLQQLLKLVIMRSQLTIARLHEGHDYRRLVFIVSEQTSNLQNFSKLLKQQLPHFPYTTIIDKSTPDIKRHTHDIIHFLDFLDEISKKSTYTIFIINDLDSKFAKYCIENADHIYIVVNGAQKPHIPQQVAQWLDIDNEKYIHPYSIVFYHESNNTPQNIDRWLSLGYFTQHYHIRQNNNADAARLIRLITSRGIGLVLSGGGTRCWATLGAIFAFKELGKDFDIVGGTSAGAIIGALIQSELSQAEIEAIFLQLSEAANLTLSRITWPLISIFNAHKGTQLLKKIFKNKQIEELWRPFFAISFNLNLNKEIIHQSGLLWQALRASAALPGIIPPMVISGDIHVDGGVINNLPVDIMRNTIGSNGKLIAIDVTSTEPYQDKFNFPPQLPFLKSLAYKLKLSHHNYHFPSFPDFFLKSLLSGSFYRQRQNYQNIDCLIRPNLSGFGLLNYKHAKELWNIGYQAAKKVIQQSPSNQL